MINENSALKAMSCLLKRMTCPIEKAGNWRNDKLKKSTSKELL